MTYDQLEVFEMIVEKGSFKAAAEALHKTQPTLSIAIKKLEGEYDLLLFNRDEYRPSLTEEGRIFLSWAKKCLRTYRELNTVAKELGTFKIEPSLLIVIDPLTRFEAIAGIFEECLAKSVPTELTLRSEILGAGMDLLLEGKADFAVAPMLTKHRDIESVAFETLELLPCIAASYGDEMNDTDLSWLESRTQIVVRSLSHNRGLSGETFGVLERGKKCYVTDHAMKRNLIREGFGWGRLAKHEVESELYSGDLKIICSKELEPITIDLHLMRNTMRPMGPVAKSIWQRLSHSRIKP
ncbi:MAG: LysR family transcriptional regulator [Chitinophagaceae bacterium]|nr:LysR family transcriptional regulator [Oligoflexus sp.]